MGGKFRRARRAKPLAWVALGAALGVTGTLVAPVAASTLKSLASRFAAVGPLEFEVAAFRLEDDGSEQRLFDGGSVFDGDHLVFEATLSDDAHVYLVNRDSTGHYAALFPSREARFAVTNPLEGRTRHRFPPPMAGEDVAFRYELDDRAGEEVFAFVASRKPSPVLESFLAGMRQVGSGSMAVASTSLQRQIQTRGVKRLERSSGLGPVSSPSPSALPVVSDDLVIQELRLRHLPR